MFFKFFFQFFVPLFFSNLAQNQAVFLTKVLSKEPQGLFYTSLDLKWIDEKNQIFQKAFSISKKVFLFF
ncbi:hypothetical protein BKH46_09300 [Helicobacter sp. 12S02634-8]|nr:hypothetical protein BKH46_09300 [Helicobacter sp. 12S02634-8]